MLGILHLSKPPNWCKLFTLLEELLFPLSSMHFSIELLIDGETSINLLRATVMASGAWCFIKAALHNFV